MLGEMRARLPSLQDWVLDRNKAKAEIEGSADIHAIARAIFYPYRWTKGCPEEAVRHMVECLGVTEADIRRYRFLAQRDAMIVQLWNWRKFEITGLELFDHDMSRVKERRRRAWA